MRSQKLSDSLGRIKKPTHVLGTTYTLSLAFFESEVFSLFNKSNLKSCTIITDRKGYENSLREGSALLEAGEGYLITSVPNSIRTFHPKVWLITSDDELLLLVGSGNLTQSGFMTNAEVFDEYYCHKKNASDEIVSDILSFLSGLEGMWEEADRGRILCVEFLKDLKETVQTFANSKSNSSNIRFLHTFNGPLIDQLPDLPNCKNIYIASPYFGRTTKGIDLLEQRYPGSKKKIYPAKHPEGDLDIDVSEIINKFPETEVNLLKTWAKSTSFAHLKVYAAFCEDLKGWFFCTSANCTYSAWKGENVEAGLLRIILNDDLLKIFQASEENLPTKLRKHYENEKISSMPFPIWATTDTFNGSFSIYIPENIDTKLPLENVEIQVSCGGERKVVLKESLQFIDHKENFLWKEFEFNADKLSGTQCLSINGCTASGEKIYTECFMENVGRLSLDPFHRRAWRGAESLLEDKDIFDHAEISQLYLLLEKGMDEDPIGAKSYTRKSTKDSGEIKFSDSIAIWPPVASDERSIVLNEIGSAALGRLDLFNRIVGSLLSEESSSEKERSGDNSLFGETIFDEESEEDSELREKIRIQRKNEADRLWESAHRRYISFLDKLKSWIPNEKKAKNFWTSATMILWITLRANNLARKRESKGALQNTPDELIRDFFKSIFYGTGGSLPLSDKLLRQFSTRPPAICVPFLMPCIVNESFNRRDFIVPQNMKFGARQVDAIISDPNELTSELISKSWEKWVNLIKPPEFDDQVESVMTELQFRDTYEELVSDYLSRK